MSARIIFFEGPPGGGKSSLSQFAARQLGAAGLDARWVEEHTLNDAVFAAFFEVLDAAPDRAPGILLGCWRALLAHEGPGIACLDGAFFHSTLKLLLAHDYGQAEIDRHLAALYELLAPARPALVHLTGDVERIVRGAIDERGGAWAGRVAEDVARYPCQRRRDLGGVDGMVSFFVESQRQLDAIGAAYPFAYHRIDTTGRDWAQYQRGVCALLGVPLRPEPPAEGGDLAEYAGAYRPPSFFPPEFNHPFEVELAPDGLRLHMVFMRNFRLVPGGRDRFAIAGRPDAVEFVRDERGAVSGVIYPFVPDQRFFCEKRS